jgi:hypothetical protein
MKEMSRKYGWTVTGIYLGLSALDFPFCFLAVRWFGTERIAEIEHTIVEGFWTVLEKVAPSLKERRAQHEATEVEDVAAAARDAGDQVVKDARHKDPGEWGSVAPLNECEDGILIDGWCRSRDSTPARVRRAQIAHLFPNPAHRRHHAESGQDFEEMGLADWKTENAVMGRP